MGLKKMYFNKRNKISSKEKIDLNEKFIQRIGYKPNGIWFSNYSSWYNFINKWEINDFKHKYIHKITLNSKSITNIYFPNKNKLLLINNSLELDLFHTIYKKNKDLINWDKVSNDYGGIEITPYNFDRRFKYNWYYSFDVAGGCIWNTNIIKNISISHIKHNDQYIKKEN